MAQRSKNTNRKFSGGEKLAINALVFMAVLILGFLLMLITGKMVVPL